MPKHIERVINPRNFIKERRVKTAKTSTRIEESIPSGVLPVFDTKPASKKDVTPGYKRKIIRKINSPHKTKTEERLYETNPIHSGQY